MSDLIVAADRCEACGFLPSVTILDTDGRNAKSHPVKYWPVYYGPVTITQKLRFTCGRCGYAWWVDPGFAAP